MTHRHRTQGTGYTHAVHERVFDIGTAEVLCWRPVKARSFRRLGVVGNPDAALYGATGTNPGRCSLWSRRRVVSRLSAEAPHRGRTPARGAVAEFAPGREGRRSPLRAQGSARVLARPALDLCPILDWHDLLVDRLSQRIWALQVPETRHPSSRGPVPTRGGTVTGATSLPGAVAGADGMRKSHGSGVWQASPRPAESREKQSSAISAHSGQSNSSSRGWARRQTTRQGSIWQSQLPSIENRPESQGEPEGASTVVRVGFGQEKAWQAGGGQKSCR